MNSEALLGLLGRHSADPLVEAALAYFAVRNRPEVERDLEDPNGPVVGAYSWVKNSRAGVEFGFQDEAAWRGMDETEYGKHPMVLTEIYFYGQHVGVRPYQGQFPFDLELSDNRATVRDKLIRFESTRHSYIRDTWDMPECRTTVAYTDNDDGIRFALCMLREPPLPPLGYALVPVPSAEAILALLGTSLDDPTLGGTLDRFGLRGRISEVKETGQVDLRNPYGLLLDFCVPNGPAKQREADIVLSAVTFYEEREQGARTWPGDLPYRIQFGDSPEALVRKLKRQADARHDNEKNFSGVAIWHEEECTVSVVYDTMENRVRRVAVAAPEAWRDGLRNCLGPPG